MRAARARLGLEQEPLAERMRALGFSAWRRQTVANAEKNTRRLNAEEVLGLALALETSIGVLMEPTADEARIALPSGQAIDAACVAWSVRHFNDGTVTWDRSAPVFEDIPESRRQRDIQDAAIGPMGRYGRYVPDKEALRMPKTVGPEDFESKGPTPGDLDDWRQSAGHDSDSEES